ncbi:MULTISPECIES: ABC transporter permease [unclassified Caballeronia]|uniref:ABC transporter permease n=1 Tax=unclassified Caballeronia TaxID=2646786 RepID=UPI002856C730|nr:MULTISPECIES: ABC transporter permease [unclassified Caballeronia]MDR5740720.1 ABC transporter permease [Caballeronia sp. LZ016]MDR5808757.1 ABC transporter permease [Caballeronia sp. LZ019]
MNRRTRLRAIARRTAWQAVPAMLAIVILNFLLLKLMPGDAADVIAGESGSATAETLQALRVKFGLDQPVLHQLWSYLSHLAHGSLGYSPRYDAPVMQLILARLPNTLILMGTALGMAIVAGIVLGAIMAHWAGKWPDRVLSVLALLLYSTPGFWIGLLAIVLFSVRLGWLPSGGDVTVGAQLHGIGHVVDVAKHVLLPATTLATFFVAIYARLTRAAMLEVQRQDFARTAHAKGLHPLRVSLRHVLRNALMPLTTMIGIHFGTLLGGAAVTETVFSWPGLGRLALDAVMARDFSVLLGVLLLSSFLVIVANVLVDLFQAWLDPRIA